MKHLARRLIHGIFLLIGVSVLSFILVELAPGDFFQQMRLNPQITPETVEALRAEYGFDRPLPLRYLRWLNSVRKGEFGFSFAYNCSVRSLLRPRARNTLILTGTAALLAWLIAIPLGVWTAARAGTWGDRVCMGLTSGLLATPDMLLALGLLFLAVRTGWFPTGGMLSVGFTQLSVWGKVKDVGAHFFLPLLALVMGTLPVLVRHVRAGMVEALASPFILAARAHGIPRRRLLFRYAFRAAANPLTSLAGFSVATLLSSSLLVEMIMSWPGVGPLLLEAIWARDLYVVIGAVMFSTFLLFAGNMLADALLCVVDPRIRA